MPQITIEYTGNVKIDFAGSGLYLRLHQLIHETTGINIENCKSRSVRRDNYFIGEGGQNKAFVHVLIDILEGRSDESKKILGQRIMDMMKEEVISDNKKMKLQITVQIREMKRKNYFKYPEGTLTL